MSTHHRVRCQWIGLLLSAAALQAQAPKLEAVLQPFVDREAVAGAVVAVADKEKVLTQAAVGFADINNKRPMSQDALFWIASMTKPITGAGLMILVDEGKVKLDDPVEKFLPEFKTLWVAGEPAGDQLTLHKVSRPITVRDIMCHTSGLDFKSAIETPTLDLVPFDIAVRSHAIAPLLFQPGTKYKYSNAGINTGGRIIEVVTGMKYEDFMQQRLFSPLGMTDTTFWPTEQQLTRLAKPYKPTADKQHLEETTIVQLYYPLSSRSRTPMPGGGLFATTADVVRFGQMVLRGGELGGKRILSEAAIKMMTSRQTPEALKESYGVGWQVTPTGAGHGGALATNLSVETKLGLVTVFMVQHAGFPKDGKDALGAFKQAAATYSK